MVNIIKDGDLFTVPADILINPVNRAGISGAGLAKEFKRRFPNCDKLFRESDPSSKPIGHLFLCNLQLDDLFSRLKIVFLATKYNPYDRHSSIELITKGLNTFKELMPAFCVKIDSFHFQTIEIYPTINMPALGCGLGGLSFEYTIKPLILDMFQDEPYTINLFEPK